MKPAKQQAVNLFRVARTLGIGSFALYLTLSAHALVGGHVQVGPAAVTGVSGPYNLLMLGQVDQAVAALRQIVSIKRQDGQAYLLLCRSFYAEEHPDDAITACESAVQDLPRDSQAQDWMGRAYGMKADLAGPISGLALARKVRDAFETAVALDPDNGAAVNDLSEFFVNAPAFIGGGQAKAAALADRAQAKLPQQAHRIRALAAEKRKDYATAEQEFKAAAAVANHADAWSDLGGFYKRRGQYDKAVDTLKHCLAIDRDKDASVVDAASILQSMNREPHLVDQALREYLTGNAKTDAAPVIRVHVMLGRLLTDAGDKHGAKIEFERSLALAADYAPAREALQELQGSR